MKKHTLQEWCDFLGVAAVKNNFQVQTNPPSVFHRKQVTVFIAKPEVVPQRLGAPCWVDTNGGSDFQDGELRLDVNTVIGSEIWQLVSDIDTVEDFRLYLPSDWGDSRPVQILSGGAIRHMAMADSMVSVVGCGWDSTKGDPISLTETKNVEQTI